VGRLSLQEIFDRQDVDVFFEVVDPDVTWRGIEEPGQEPPICRNRAEVRQVFEHHLASGRTGRFEIVAEAGDRIVVDPHPEPPVPGLEEIHHVYTLCDGRIVRMQDYPDRASAFGAVGLL